MNKKIFSKILAIMLAFTLTLSNFIFLAVYATNVNYETQETNINKTDISFDAYFISEEGNKIHTKVTEMNNNELKLFLSVSVTKGYLKDAVISISNTNFKLVKGEELPTGVQSIDVEGNRVILNQINKGEAREIELPIEIVKDEKFNLDNFSKDANVKLTGTFVNNSGKEIKVEKTIIVNLALSEQAESYLSGKISKYTVFEEESKKKALLQLTISSKVIDNLLPVKSTQIAIQVPNLFGQVAEKVSVTSSSTKATNGNNGTDFNDNNYTYSDGIILLKTINEPNSNNEVNWVKNSTDEYIINLVYSVGAPFGGMPVREDTTVTKEDKIQLTMASRLSLYNNEEKQIDKEVSGELNLPEASDGVVSYAINNKENEIAKGYMLVKDAMGTEYKQEIKVNIGYTPTLNNIEISKDEENYTDEAGNVYKATTYYKQIEVKRENLVKILGEDGTIDIMSDGVTLATLDKYNSTYIFEGEVSNLNIFTSKPEKDGILIIETEKYIKSAEYNEEITNSINKFTTSIIGKVNAIEEKATTETPLVQPRLQVSSSINSSNLSTVIENENVEIRVALQTNNNTNRLYKNPVIEIELPSYIEKIDVKTINILYNAELKAKSGDIITNSNGNKVIRVVLEGEQTKFNDILSVEGTTLIIGANITVDKTAPSITEKMNVRVINNNEETVETNSNITYMAPTGIITLNSISGYNNEEKELTSMSGETQTGKLDIAAKSKVATEKITIINNNDYTCGDVSILGRTPAEGNKSLSTNSDLGSTFTAEMVSKIKPVEGIENKNVAVYYSENENATKDLNDSNNGWTENAQNLENVKSYLIQVDSQMEKGDKLAFSYDIEIPEGLSRQESTYSAYQVSYKNLDGALQGRSETVSAPVVGLSTGTGPELKVELSANVQNGAKVKEGQRIEYTIKVTNIGTTEVKDVEVKAKVPAGSHYTKYELDSTQYVYEVDSSVKEFTDTIKNLAVGQSKEAKFILTVGSITEFDINQFVKREDYDSDEAYNTAIKQLFVNRADYDSDESYNKALEETKVEDIINTLNSTTVEVEANAIAYDDNKPITFTSNKIVNEKEKGYLDLQLSMRENARLEAGTDIIYDLSINKLGIDNIKNVKITCEIPDGLKYKSSTYNEEEMKQEINGSKITWSTDELKYSNNITLEFTLDEIKQDREISLKMLGTCDEYNGTIESNTEKFVVGNPKLEISHSSSNKTGNLTEGDEIVYTIVVKNTSIATAYDVTVKDYLSEGLSLQSVKYTMGETTDTYKVSGTNYNLTKDIPGNSSLIIELTARANELGEQETEKTVSNRFEVQGSKIDKLSSSTIEHKINKTSYTIDDNNQTMETSSISGVAWLDENGDGIRDINEKFLPQIPVILINQKGQVEASSITDENGVYIFNNLVSGNYIVVFLYDTANYDVTAYGIGEATVNNDAVSINLKIDSTPTICAATNVINLSSNVYNMDLGLIVSPKFDLSLEKTISKITVKSSKGTTTNTYNNSKLEKVEIPSKNLQGATVTVEYAITVTNNGAIAGYASKIVDYLSSTDLKFNSETNADWYLGTDGNIYNSSLSNNLLQPGESKTLKLVLTKQVTENNTGLTNNTAEIYESYNDEGIEDYNSTPGNRAQNENDLGQADIIIGPKTGVVIYLGIIILFITALTIGIYVVNKKVIKKI